MSKLPILSASEMEKVLLTLGFVRVRQKGSHIFYRHPDGHTTTLPHHQGRDLARPLLREVLHEIDLSIDQFLKLLD
jgi:predicted RNA binding protein YcfA (HicA-like mRNA interferase family)